MPSEAVPVERRGRPARDEIGDAVHRLLEQVDLARRRARPRRRSGRYPTVSDEELERIRGFVASYCESELARRVAALEGVEKERHFTFEHDGVLAARLRRRVSSRDGRGARRRLQDERARRGVAGRDRRAGLPAAAARLRARVLPGRRRGGRGRLPLPRAAGRASCRRRFTRADVPELEAELSAAIARIQAGEFRPTPSEFACAGCPALDLVCAGPRLRPRLPAEAVAS